MNTAGLPLLREVDPIPISYPTSYRVPDGKELGLRGQCAEVYEYMRVNGSITAMDAVRFGCCRLAARILDLKKKAGVFVYSITEKNANGGRHARYFLRSEHA